MSSREQLQRYNRDNELGFQVDWPVFVKQPFDSFGKRWKKGEEFNWINQQFNSVDFWKIRKKVQTLYNQGFIHHDSSREVEQKVGDRLGELDADDLMSLCRQLNAIVKKRTTTTKEYQDKKIKQSKIVEKQRGIIRAWLYRNAWASDEFYSVRDKLLESKSPEAKLAKQQEQQQDTE